MLPSGNLSGGLRADIVGVSSCILKAIDVGLLILPPKKGTCLVTEQTFLFHTTENFHLHFLDCGHVSPPGVCGYPLSGIEGPKAALSLTNHL